MVACTKCDIAFNLEHTCRTITSYMEPLVRLLEEAGYVAGKDLFGAPYDFRYGLAAPGHPSHVGSKFLNDLKELVESASNSNGGKPVILLSHSLGGLFALELLNRNPVFWSNKYIKHLVALSAPWGGTVEELSTFASGNTFGAPLVNPLFVREEQRSCSSNLWLMPSPKVFNGTKPLVVTPSATYSSSDISQFLLDIGYPEGVGPYKTRILPLVESLAVPEVPVTCIFGSGVETVEKLVYATDDFDERPEVVYGDGDGTVNMISLLALESEWVNSNKSKALKVIKIPDVTHTSILKDSVALHEIIDEILLVNSGKSLVQYY